MAHRTDVHTFEFLDVSGPAAPEPSNDGRPPRHLTAIVAMASVVLALIFAGVALSGNDEDRAAVPVEPVERNDFTTVASNPPSLPAVPIDDGGRVDPQHPWPDPPEDHNPTVIGRPGNAPVFGATTNSTVVYVNALGRPTLVDLDSGSIQQVDVALTRSYDFFGVEFGRVVSFDDLRRNFEPASDRAILFHVHRAGSLTSIDEFRTSPNPSPHLCISEEPCSEATWAFERVTNGVDTIRRANDLDDPDVIEMLFGDSWMVDGIHRIAPADFGFNYRVPAPLNDEVWIVVQPTTE